MVRLFSITTLLLLLYLSTTTIHGFAQLKTDSALEKKSERKYIFTVDPIGPTADEYLPVSNNGVFHEAIQGTWKVDGYGFVLHVTREKLEWFSETRQCTWKHPENEIGDMLFAIQETTGRAYIKPYPTEGAYILERMDVLPAKFSAPASGTSKETLRAITSTMTDYYPFFKERNIDWANRVNRALSKVDKDTTEQAFFETVDELFDGLNDGHTFVSAIVNGQPRVTKGGMSSIRSALETAYKAKADEVDRSEFFRAWSTKLFSDLENEILSGKAQSAFDGTLIWGKIDSKVGYLFIKNMFNFGNEDSPLTESLGSLHQQLEEIFEQLKNCDAIVIDVSINQGGIHSFALAFASHIADRQRFGLCKYPIGRPDLLQKFDVLPYRNAEGEIKTFTKPVYVLTTDATLSAGEEFVMAARVFPHVKIVGNHTQGILSDILEKPLPNGWSMGQSNEIFLDHEGKCFEGIGIPVDLPREIFDLKNITEVGHAKAVIAIADEISQ